MVYIKGYKFTTESEAKEAVNSCNLYYGIPKNSADITKNWVNYKKAELNNPLFYYIIYNKTLDNIFGKPIEFNIIVNENF
jgi:hypothetical protein